MASESGTLDSKEMKTRRMFEKYRTVDSGPDLGKKLDEAGILAAKRPGGVGGVVRLGSGASRKSPPHGAGIF